MPSMKELNNLEYWVECFLLLISMIISVPPGQKQRESICRGGRHDGFISPTYCILASFTCSSYSTCWEISSQQLLDAHLSLVTANLKQCFPYEWPFSHLPLPMFPWLWWLFFQLIFSPSPTQSFSCYYSRLAFRGWKFGSFRLICETENRMKGLGHCLMQAVNYTGSNEIKLIKAIKSNKKPYRSQINRVSLDT